MIYRESNNKDMLLYIQLNDDHTLSVCLYNHPLATAKFGFGSDQLFWRARGESTIVRFDKRLTCTTKRERESRKGELGI